MSVLSVVQQCFYAVRERLGRHKTEGVTAIENTRTTPSNLIRLESDARMNNKNLLYKDLERLERDLITALYGVWRAMGKDKKIVKAK